MIYLLLLGDRDRAGRPEPRRRRRSDMSPLLRALRFSRRPENELRPRIQRPATFALAYHHTEFKLWYDIDFRAETFSIGFVWREKKLGRHSVSTDEIYSVEGRCASSSFWRLLAATLGMSGRVKVAQ